MEWTTHALSGLAGGYFVTNDWRGAVVGAVASMIPDLDEPKSKVGRPLFFISLPLNQLVGHRTLTHSLLFVFLMTAFIFPFSPLVAGATMAGLTAHIIGDMLTGRVQLFFPFQKTFVGIKVSRFGYTLIDFMTRVFLSIIVIFAIWKEIL